MSDNKEKVTALLKKTKEQGTLKGFKPTEQAAILQELKPQLLQALPKHLTPERMIQMAVHVMAKNPKIAECETVSIVGAVMQASIMGLSLVPALAECYIVPYNTRGPDGKYRYYAQFQMGYRGYIHLARNSGLIKTIYANSVYPSDEFVCEMGLERKMLHKPDMAADYMEEELIYTYAVAHYKDGGFDFVVLPKKKIELLRARSKTNDASSSPWKTDYKAMSEAKAIKQLSKWLPLESENLNLQTAAFVDEKILTPQMYSGGRLEDELVDSLPENQYVLPESDAAEQTTPAAPQEDIEDAPIKSRRKKTEAGAVIVVDNVELPNPGMPLPFIVGEKE